MNVNVSTVKPAYIDVFQYSIKKSNQFTCLGWVSNPVFSGNSPLVTLAVSDTLGVVTGSESAIKFELAKDGSDHRLQFSNAKSKKINKAVGISLVDNKWHFLGYVCTGEGDMRFYVDSILIPAEDGTGDNGIPYSKAWSHDGRQGGGFVWSPFLYLTGQAVSVYNWRFGANFQIHQGWIKELEALERPIVEAV